MSLNAMVLVLMVEEAEDRYLYLVKKIQTNEGAFQKRSRAFHFETLT